MFQVKIQLYLLAFHSGSGRISDVAMELVLSNKQLINFMTLVAIGCFFTRAITGNDVFLFVGAALGGAIFCCQLLARYRLSTMALVVFLISTLSYVFTFLNNGFEHGLLFIPLLIACSGIAWRISTNGINYRFCWFLFYGSLAYFLIMLYVFDFSRYSLFAHSRNHISVYFINAASLLYIAGYQSKHAVKVMPAIATLVVSVISIGIGGIIASTAFVGLLVFYKLFGGFRGSKTLLLFMTAAVLYTVAFVWDAIAIYLITEFNIEGDLISKIQNLFAINESERYLIWSEYIESLDFMRMMTGVYLGEAFYGYNNLHSSYFLLHARMGYFAFLLIAFFIYVLVKLYIINYLFASCYFVLLLRGLSDTTFLAGSSFDFVFLFLFLFAIFPTYREKNKLTTIFS